jgi:subtilisin family serine protease
MKIIIYLFALIFSFYSIAGFESDEEFQNQQIKPDKNIYLNSPEYLIESESNKIRRYVVKFTKDTSAQKRLEIHKKYGANINFELLQTNEINIIESSKSEKELMDLYKSDKNVIYIEPEIQLQILKKPNDSRYKELWGLNNTGQSEGLDDADINAEQAWDITTGTNTNVIAVIDSGVDYNHNDLKANMWINPNEIAGDGIDNDNNGYIDDIYGIDTYNDDSDPMDDNDHGTHVAGTIAAKGNNSLGVVGVNWNTKIIACKFLSRTGRGTTIGAIKCLDYLAKLKTQGINIIASNNSWGGGDYSQALYDVIKLNQDKGILFVAAAGNSNENNDEIESYPSNYDLSNIISVAATNNKDELAYFSSYGKQKVHVAAPGVKILSTVTNNNYKSFNGTSMATPHVTGLIGLLKTNDQSLNMKQIKALLISSSKPVAGLKNKILSGGVIRAWDDISTGGGALNCNNKKKSKFVYPANNVINTPADSIVNLKYYEVNCDKAITTATATVDDGTKISLTGDDDIILSGSYSFTVKAKKILTFPDNSTLTINIVSPYEKAIPVGYSYQNITGTRLPLEDEETVVLDIPFNSNFSGINSGKKIYVNSNGFISFEDKIIVWPYKNKELPSNDVGSMSIVAFWDDLYPGSSILSSGVFWDVIGSAPNRKIVIEWRDVRHYSTRLTNNNITFQIILEENSPDIRVNYKDMVFSSQNHKINYGKSATIGIQQTANYAKQHCFNASCLINNNTSLIWKLKNDDKPPIINSVSLEGYQNFVAGLTLTFVVDAKAQQDKTITQYEIDFNGDNIIDYKGTNNKVSYKYNEVGDYIYNIKVIDSDNKFTNYYKSINILLDAKEIVENAILDYKEKIIADPSLLNLFSQDNLEEQLTNLREQIVANPDNYGLLPGDAKITTSKIESLSPGWHLLSNPVKSETDLFASAKAVFYYDNQKYYAHSNDEEISKWLSLENDIGVIISIPAGLGIWVLK